MQSVTLAHQANIRLCADWK